jgi:hypothetical protein
VKGGCDVDRSQDKKCLPFLAAVAALGILWAAPSALAQSSPAPSSVLPTGGGQGLIDPSDSVMLLLDHQTGLFAGFKVYAMIDASGDPSDLASRTTLARFTQAGVMPTSTNAVLSEVHRIWSRPEASELAKLYALVAPNYAAVIESFNKAQEVARQQGPPVR